MKQIEIEIYLGGGTIQKSIVEAESLDAAVCSVRAKMKSENIKYLAIGSRVK